MRRPPARRPEPSPLVLDDAFVAAALVHEPSARERAGRVPVAEALVLPVRSNLDVYLVGVAMILALFLASVALDRLFG